MCRIKQRAFVLCCGMGPYHPQIKTTSPLCEEECTERATGLRSKIEIIGPAFKQICFEAHLRYKPYGSIAYHREPPAESHLYTFYVFFTQLQILLERTLMPPCLILTCLVNLGNASAPVFPYIYSIVADKMNGPVEL